MEDTASRDTGAAGSDPCQHEQLCSALSELTCKQQTNLKTQSVGGVTDEEQDLRSEADQRQGPEGLEHQSWVHDDGQTNDQHTDGADGPTKSQICFDFTKGMCMRGDKCKFSHDLATIVHFNSKEKGICFDYLRSSCQRGLLCRFSHDLSTIAQQCQVFNGIATKGRTNAICYDFVKGVCQRGSDCRYSHDLSLIARTARGGLNTTRGGEVCYDYLRGRCSRGVNCKYSHNISFLGTTGMYPQGMSEGGSSAPSQSSGGSSAGGAVQQGAALLLQQGSAFHGMQASPMPDNDDHHGADLVPCGRSMSAHATALWSHPSAEYAVQRSHPSADYTMQQQVAAGCMHHGAPTQHTYGHMPPRPGSMPAQPQHHYPSNLPFAPMSHGGMAYMQQLQQAAVAASMQQQQGLRNMRRNSADCANSSLAAATAHQAAAIYHRLHGVPPAPVNSLLAQVCSADLGGWHGPAPLPFHGQHGHARRHPNHAGSEASSLAESYSTPAAESYTLVESGSAADAAHLASLPPSLLPLLKEIWSK